MKTQIIPETHSTRLEFNAEDHLFTDKFDALAFFAENVLSNHLIAEHFKEINKDIAISFKAKINNRLFLISFNAGLYY